MFVDWWILWDFVIIWTGDTKAVAMIRINITVKRYIGR